MDEPHSRLRVWIRATRPFSLSGSVIPVILGGISAYRVGSFHIGLFFLAIAAIAAMQIGANLMNSADDFLNHVDTKESFGSSDVIVNQILSPKQVNRAGIGVFFIGLIIGLYLAYVGGTAILLLGLAGALGGYFYSKKPFELKYHGLGVPLIFLLYGPLPVLGAFYLQTGYFDWRTLLLSIPTGLLTTAILHANDIRDMIHDRKAGIKTFSLLIGSRKAHILYNFLIVTAYLVSSVLPLIRIIPLWSFAVLLTLPLAVKNIKKLHSAGENPADIKWLDKDTAQLQMIFGLIQMVSLIIP